jgi:16S rRNA (cytidine1402-2'-O)-methyltransferase
VAKGTLLVVATPLGNVDDCSPRARAALASADAVLCEDTRHTGVLLKALGVSAHKLISYHQHSGLARVDQIVALLKAGQTLALVTDAGTPGISDPGNLLVKEVREQLGDAVNISPIPGPSAVAALASVSGLPTDSFLFLGFLPHKKGRQTLLKEIASSNRTVILYESVHRIEKLLTELIAACGSNRYVVVGRELTKKFEAVHAGSLSEVQAQVLAEPVKGEYVVAIAPARRK